ncbi:hypothetical protein SAMN02745866_01571 [Alteromonadaceae bacterium Bs31]|nr:hypothetical protein SAMN02745866_01571 [Alteromonadaceae bacterium Bs31]
MLAAAQCFSEYKDTANVNIEMISVWGSTGQALVQTNPKHNIEGLKCTGDYWLTLEKTDAGYQSLLSMLIAAQVSGKIVTVRAEDDNLVESFCRLQRVIIHK